MSAARLRAIGAASILALAFYFAHRSDHTVSNRLLHCVCGPSVYASLQQVARDWLPIPSALRGCLPSALWCFIGTCAFADWKIRMRRGYAVSLAWACPFMNAMWELVQAVGWTNGRADILDVGAGLAGWLSAHVLFFRAAQSVEIPAWWHWRTGVVLTCFASMGLAAVWR